jgi:hypothetical protein
MDNPALSLPIQTIFLLALDCLIVFTVIVAAILAGRAISVPARAAFASISIVLLGAGLVMLDSFAAIDSYNRSNTTYIKLALPPSMSLSLPVPEAPSDCVCRSVKYKDRENHVETVCSPPNCDGQQPAR